MSKWHVLREWWREFVAVWRYVRDPHGFEQTRRRALALRFAERPAMYQQGDTLIVHPALEPRLRREVLAAESPLVTSFPARYDSLFGMPLFLSVFAVEKPPPGGWPDVQVPERPRWRP